MKYLLSLGCLCLSLLLTAQTNYRTAIGGRTVEFLEIDELTIVGYGGNELEISREGGEKKQDERADGLRKISPSGRTDNTGLGLSVRETDDRLRVEQIGRGSGRIVVRIPNDAVVRFEQSTYHGGELRVRDFSGELDVNMAYHGVELRNCYGPLSVSTVYAGIEATFTAGPPRTDLRLHAAHAAVDLTLPASTAADLKLNADYGSMYTDFDIETERKTEEGLTRYGGDGRLTGTINGGGPAIVLTSGYSNIYLRQLK